MSERSAQNRIAAAARARGWWVCWTHRSEHSPAGEPDLRLLWAGEGACPGPARYLMVELKAADARGRYGQRTEEQRRYAAWAALAGLCVLEVRWPDDQAVVEAALGVEFGAAMPEVSGAPDARAASLARRVAALLAEGHGRLAAERIAAEEERAYGR